MKEEREGEKTRDTRSEGKETVVDGWRRKRRGGETNSTTEAAFNDKTASCPADKLGKAGGNMCVCVLSEASGEECIR